MFKNRALKLSGITFSTFLISPIVLLIISIYAIINYQELIGGILFILLSFITIIVASLCQFVMFKYRNLMHMKISTTQLYKIRKQVNTFLIILSLLIAFFIAPNFGGRYDSTSGAY